MRYHYDLNPLAVGGEKVVHKGVCVELNSEVVIKFLRTPYSPEDRKRFAVEIERMERAKIAAGAGVSTIIEYDLFHEPPFYVEEFFSEGTLAKKMADIFVSGHLFSDGAAVGYCRQILHSLQKIHEGGQIHRDLKPANILVREKSLVITDMGIGRTLARPTFLQTRAFCGTMGYAAPEQELASNGNGVDHRADLYAVGVILHEMLTGKRGAWNQNLYRGNQMIVAFLNKILSFSREYRHSTASEAARVIDLMGIATR